MWLYIDLGLGVFLGSMIFILLGAILLFRVAYLVVLNNAKRRVRFRRSALCTQPITKTARAAIVMGSGGHTMEMLKLARGLNTLLFRPRCYILADTDVHSEHKIYHLEDEIKQKEDYKSEFSLHRIPRSRKVGQSWLSSFCTTLMSILSCIPLVLHLKPDLILANGPGTCVPICLIGFALKVFFIQFPTIVYVESICRVKSLSLSAKILRIFVDSLIVQWPELQTKYPDCQYIGRIV